MTEKVLKHYLRDKYGLKVKATGWDRPKYFVLERMRGFDGCLGWCPVYSNNEKYSVCKNKLYDKISDIIDDIENNKVRYNDALMTYVKDASHGNEANKLIEMLLGEKK